MAEPRLMPRYLLDTNLLLYAYDRREPLKQTRALEVLERLGDSLSAALSTQNLAEFANIAFETA